MLILSRKPQEKIRIGDDIVITVLRTKGKTIRLGIEAPSEVPVLRGELAFEMPADSSQQVESEGSGSASERSNGLHPPVEESSATRLVEHKRVSRTRRAQIVPSLVHAGGPLRAMLDSRSVPH